MGATGQHEGTQRRPPGQGDSRARESGVTGQEGWLEWAGEKRCLCVVMGVGSVEAREHLNAQSPRDEKYLWRIISSPVLQPRCVYAWGQEDTKERLERQQGPQEVCCETYAVRMWGSRDF